MAEAVLDDIIDYCVRFASKNRRTLMGISLVLLAVFSNAVVLYVRDTIVGPVREAVALGLTRTQLGTAVGLGITSGLSAPGLTMLALLAMGEEGRGGERERERAIVEAMRTQGEW